MVSLRITSLCPAARSIVLAAAAGCGVEKSENPLSPSVAGPIAGVEITRPASGGAVERHEAQALAAAGQADGRERQQQRRPAAVIQLRGGERQRVPVEGIRAQRRDARHQRQDNRHARCARPSASRTTGAPERKTAPTPVRFVTAAFEVLPQPDLGAPTLVSPINNERVASCDADDHGRGVDTQRRRRYRSPTRFRWPSTWRSRKSCRAALLTNPAAQVSYVHRRLAAEPHALLARARQRWRNHERVGGHADVPDAAPLRHRRRRPSPAPHHPAAPAPRTTARRSSRASAPSIPTSAPRSARSGSARRTWSSCATGSSKPASAAASTWAGT